jgi:hypothetical protein
MLQVLNMLPYEVEGVLGLKVADSYVFMQIGFDNNGKIRGKQVMIRFF